MSVMLRVPTLTDAVGAGLAHYAFLRSQYPQAQPDYWQTCTEESLVEFWHDAISHQELGTRMAIATKARRVVGVALLRPADSNDRGTGRPARNSALEVLGVIPEYQGGDIEQRLLDFVLPFAQPAQTWVDHDDRERREFFRRNGFTMDGLTVKEPATQTLACRMVK